MPSFTQADLMAWLLKCDRPLYDRLTRQKANVKTPKDLDAIAETNHERAIIAALADLVRTSDLPKNSPGIVGKPQPPKHAAGNDMEPVPARSLADVMDEDAEEAVQIEREHVTPPPQMAAIAAASKAKIEARKEQLRLQAQKMRDANAAKRAALKAAEA